MNISTVSDLITSIIDNYEDFDYQIKTKSFTDVDIDIKHLKDKESYIGREYAKLQYHNVITFSIEDFNITLNIYTIFIISPIEVQKIVNRIGTMIKVFKENIVHKVINIHMLNYNAPRFIPEQYSNSPDEFEKIYEYDLFNCTNGYYQKRKDNINIVITRENTNKGLLTHELCHMCSLDFGGYGMFDKWNEDKKKYGITTRSEFTEGINNAMSSIIHSVFVSIEKGGDFKEEFRRTFYSEYQYAKDMVANLLHYFKCDKLSELKENGYNQNSMVFEYIVLRYVYLKYLKKLFHFNYENDNNEDSYYDLFIECLEKEDERIFKFNERMIIDDKQITRMEYYLF